MVIKLEAKAKSFEGSNEVYSHFSETVKTPMKFAIYQPSSKPKHAIFFLSGLTCTEQNFITKSGIQSLAAKYDVMVVAPDTSPRGANIEGEKDSWDFGVGASFYVNATTEKWKNNYRMYDYVTDELYQIISNEFQAKSFSIMGHSMGGHGALIMGLREPDKFKKISAFAPICNPVNCPWGIKAFENFLGSDKKSWGAYDATELVNTSKYQGEILIDQGSGDEFLEKQLLPKNLIESAKHNSRIQVKYREHEDYDHSYYFISSFLEDHVKFHVEARS